MCRKVQKTSSGGILHLANSFCLLVKAYFPKEGSDGKASRKQDPRSERPWRNSPGSKRQLLNVFHLETIWQFEVYTDSHQQQLCISFWPTCLIPKIYSPCPVSITLSSAKPCSPLSGSVGVISQLKISPRIGSASTKRGPAEQAGEKVAGTIS